MILQRLSASIRKQDWFTVLIETLIVVLGVFLGLQVNNWNEARLEDRRAAEIHDALVADFIVIRDQLQRHEASARTAMENAIELQRLLGEGGGGLSAYEIAQKVGPATSWAPAVGGSPTYAELVAAGDLNLVRPEAASAALSEFDRKIARLQTVNTTLQRLLYDKADVLFRISYLGEQDEADMSASFRAMLEADIASPEAFVEASIARDILRGDLQFASENLDLAKTVLAALGEDPEATGNMDHAP